MRVHIQGDGEHVDLFSPSVSLWMWTSQPLGTVCPAEAKSKGRVLLGLWRGGFYV